MYSKSYLIVNVFIPMGISIIVNVFIPMGISIIVNVFIPMGISILQSNNQMLSVGFF